MTESPSLEEIWRKYDSVEQRLSAPLTERMLDLARVQEGINVLDLATGRGEPAIPAALRVAPEQAAFYELPRVALSRVVRREADNHDLPSTFYYSDLNRLTDHLMASGFELKHTEVMDVDVMEVASDEALVSWARTFGMWRLLANLTSSQQQAWERELRLAAEPYRTNYGTIRFGGLSRLIVAG